MLKPIYPRFLQRSKSAICVCLFIGQGHGSYHHSEFNITLTFLPKKTSLLSFGSMDAWFHFQLDSLYNPSYWMVSLYITLKIFKKKYNQDSLFNREKKEQSDYACLSCECCSTANPWLGLPDELSSITEGKCSTCMLTHMKIYQSGPHHCAIFHC